MLIALSYPRLDVTSLYTPHSLSIFSLSLSSILYLTPLTHPFLYS